VGNYQIRCHWSFAMIVVMSNIWDLATRTARKIVFFFFPLYLTLRTEKHLTHRLVIVNPVDSSGKGV